MLWEYKPTQSMFRPKRVGTFVDSVDFRRYDDLRRHTGSSQNTNSASTSNPLLTKASRLPSTVSSLQQRTEDHADFRTRAGATALVGLY